MFRVNNLLKTTTAWFERHSYLADAYRKPYLNVPIHFWINGNGNFTRAPVKLWLCEAWNCENLCENLPDSLTGHFSRTYSPSLKNTLLLIALIFRNEDIMSCAVVARNGYLFPNNVKPPTYFALTSARMPYRISLVFW